MFDAILFDLADTLLHFGKVRPLSLFGQGCRDTHDYLVERRLSPPDYATYRKVSLRAFTGRYIWSNMKGRDFNGLDVIANVMRKLKIQASERDLHTMAWMWYRPVLLPAPCHRPCGYQVAWWHGFESSYILRLGMPGSIASCVFKGDGLRSRLSRQGPALPLEERFLSQSAQAP